MTKHSFFGLQALAMGMAAAIDFNGLARSTGFGLFTPKRSRKFRPAKVRRAGRKVARQCYQGVATLRHQDGVIAATIRDNETRKHAK